MMRFEPPVYTHYVAKKETPCTVDFISSSLMVFKERASIHPTFLGSYLMVYVDEGSLSLEVEGAALDLQKNNLLLISPFVNYKGTVDPAGDTARFYIVEFNCSNFVFFGLQRYAFMQCADAARSVFAELNGKYARNEESSYIYDVLLLQIIYIAEKIVTVATPQRQLAEKLRDYILQNLMKAVTAQSVAGEFKYNKDYLGRVFKAEYGTTIKDYINDRKLNMAKKLLSTSDMSVASVGEFLGWQDVNQFLKFFKYHEGMTPGQYKKSLSL